MTTTYEPSSSQELLNNELDYSELETDTYSQQNPDFRPASDEDELQPYQGSEQIADIRQFHDYFLGQDAQARVENWRPLALGRRPKDFMARDLLLNSLWRDFRPRIFHGLAVKPPEWIESRVSHLPRSQQKQAIQLDVLHLLHQKQLCRLVDEENQRWPLSDYENQILAKLAECWPYGAHVQPPEGTSSRPGRFGRHCCRLAWLCPWCCARRVVSLYERLRAGPLRHPEGKHLVLARFSTPGELPEPDHGWIWEGMIRRGDVSGYYLQGKSKIRRMRRAVIKHFSKLARKLNITGGIVTHQISSGLTGRLRADVRSGCKSFRHDFAMLGEVQFKNEDEKKEFQECTRVMYSDYGRVDFSANISRSEHIAPCFWSFHPADDAKQDALRLFLAGSSANYPVRTIEYHAGDAGGKLDRAGVRGAFVNAGSFMMDATQWWSLVEATHDLPIYIPFGTWRTGLGQQKKDTKKATKAPSKSVAKHPPSRQQKAALQRHNDVQKETSKTSFEQLLKFARPLYMQMLAEKDNKRGRPASRSRLQSLLADNGYVVSEHQMKKLMSALKSNSFEEIE